MTLKLKNSLKLILDLLVYYYSFSSFIVKKIVYNALGTRQKPFKGTDYLRFFFFLILNLEAWNLACICKIEIP